MRDTHTPGIAELRGIYSRIREPQPQSTIAGRLLNELRIRLSVSPQNLANIPRSGPTVLVLNNLLTAIPELTRYLIPIDVLGNAHSDDTAAMKQALQRFIEGGLLVIFPAGEVSAFQLRKLAVTDAEWHPSIARIVLLANRRRTDVKVVPAFLTTSNSALFHSAGLIHPRLRTVLLVHELLNKRGAQVELRIGRAIPAARLEEFAHGAHPILTLAVRTPLRAPALPTAYAPATAPARQTQAAAAYRATRFARSGNRPTPRRTPARPQRGSHGLHRPCRAHPAHPPWKSEPARDRFPRRRQPAQQNPIRAGQHQQSLSIALPRVDDRLP